MKLVTYQQPVWAFYLELLFSFLSLALILIIVARILSSSSADFLTWDITLVQCEAIKAQAPLILGALASSLIRAAMTSVVRIIPPECVSIRPEAAPQERN